MERKCQLCNHILKNNCYLQDSGTNTLSYLTLIIKDDNLKKKGYELKSSYCPNCGHVETWIELDELKKSGLQSK